MVPDSLTVAVKIYESSEYEKLRSFFFSFSQLNTCQESINHHTDLLNCQLRQIIRSKKLSCDTLFRETKELLQWHQLHFRGQKPHSLKMASSVVSKQAQQSTILYYIYYSIIYTMETTDSSLVEDLWVLIDKLSMTWQCLLATQKAYDILAVSEKVCPAG